MNKRIAVALVAVVVAMAMAPAVPAEGRGAVTGAGDHTTPHQIGIDSLSKADRASQQSQEPLLLLNDKVYDVTAGQYDAHFAGSSVDTPHRSLVVYWAGQVPSALVALRAQAARNGVTLVIRPARFSHSQLMQAAYQVVPDAMFVGTGVSIDVPTDGSGLTVHEGDLPTVARGARAATAVESALLDRIAATHRRTGIPIAVAAARSGTAKLADVGPPSRHGDQNAYWAGAMMLNSVSGKGCTSGFSMYATGDPISLRFTLTAAHCAANGPDTSAPGFGYADGIPITNYGHVAMGQSNFVHELYDAAPSYDLGVVDLSGGQSNMPFIYEGMYRTDGAISVAGYASGGIVKDGNYCVHGTTDIDCELIAETGVVDCGTTIKWPPLGRCVYTIGFHNKDFDQSVGCDGDSGAPVYYWSGNNVIAAGVYDWGWTGFTNGNPNGFAIHSVDWNADVWCAYRGGISVVASAVNRVPGLRVVTLTAP